jgi:hypothetical protein
MRIVFVVPIYSMVLLFYHYMAWVEATDEDELEGL